MSTRETSPEIASLAGRILAAGNPLDNSQVVISIIDGLATANTGKQAQEALKAVLGSYFENMLSLAGSCLSQAEDDDGQPPRVQVTATVEWDEITNAIVGAFEGGSGYWLREYEYTHTPDGIEGRPAYAENEFWSKGGKMRVTYDNPEEGDDRLSKEIGMPEIKAGLRSMAEKSSRHFDDLISENDDAITHDVFIQHVIFGEVIYG
jgi:hypothetical protein